MSEKTAEVVKVATNPNTQLPVQFRGENPPKHQDPICMWSPSNEQRFHFAEKTRLTRVTSTVPLLLSLGRNYE